MKQAYITLVIISQSNENLLSEISTLDQQLSLVAIRHEIVLVKRFGSEKVDFSDSKLNGPVSIVYTQNAASENELSIAGLGRSVGDFIIEWLSAPSLLTDEILTSLLLPSDVGAEIVEVLPMKVSAKSRIFYRLVNIFRSSSYPVNNSIARVYSRRALNRILEVNQSESQIMVLVAELPFVRLILRLPIFDTRKHNLNSTLSDGFQLLLKGSRFGTIVPLLFSVVSSISGILFALYAFTIHFFYGKSVEGWTSLAVLIGLGQGAVLALIGLVWSRLDGLARGLSRRNDVTSDVQVYPTKN